MNVQATRGQVRGWGERFITGEMVDVYIDIFSWTNNNHPPTGEEAGGGLGMSDWRRWGSKTIPKIQNETPRIYLQVLTPTIGQDGGAEAAEVTNNNATMILIKGGRALVAKIM